MSYRLKNPHDYALKTQYPSFVAQNHMMAVFLSPKSSTIPSLQSPLLRLLVVVGTEHSICLPVIHLLTLIIVPVAKTLATWAFLTVISRVIQSPPIHRHPWSDLLLLPDPLNPLMTNVS